MPIKLFNYLQLVRAPAVFTALSNILAAHLIVTQGQFQWLNLVLLLAVSALLYMSGMAMNDCFDYNEDCHDRPERPLPSGRIAIKTAWKFSWVLMASGILLASLIGYKQLLLALILAFFIIVYNGYTKHTKLGFLTMGGCRYLNWLLGLSIIQIQLNSLILASPIFLYVCSLTLLSTVETTARSRLYLNLCGIGMIVTALSILYIQLNSSNPHAVSFIVLVISLLFILKYMIRAHQNFTPQQIQKTIKLLVLGIIPLDAILVLSEGPWWGSFMILLVLIPGWKLGHYMRVT